jgi:hypothetical protein
MRSFRSSGSVEGVMGNRHPYSDSNWLRQGTVLHPWAPESLFPLPDFGGFISFPVKFGFKHPGRGVQLSQFL